MQWAQMGIAYILWMQYVGLMESLYHINYIRMGSSKVAVDGIIQYILYVKS